MPHEHPAHHLPVFVQLRPADLPVHLAQGRRRDGWVVPRAGQPCRQLRVGVFVVRQIDVDQALQLPQRLNRFIAAAVVDDGYGKPRRQRREDGRQKMRRRDKVDGLRALVDEAQERFAQGLRCQRLARAAGRDDAVLAIAAAQRAAAEKHRARAVIGTDRRLLAIVEHGARRAQLPRHPAEAKLTRFAVNAAPPRAERTGSIRKHGTSLRCGVAAARDLC